MVSFIGLMLPSLSPSIATADWRAKLSIESAWESNLFLDSTPESGLATETALQVAHGWDLQPWAVVVAWEGNLTVFTEYPENDYLLQTARITAQRKLDETHWIRWGGRTAWRTDREASASDDYREFGAYMEARPPLGNRIDLTTGYGISHRAYESMEGLDHTEHLLYGRAKLPLEGGMNVTLSTEAGYRQYADISHDSPGAMHGVDGGSGNSSGDRHGIGQWLNSLTVSTPLFDNRSGLQAYARLRNNFGDGRLPGSGTNATHYAGDELFDDRYGYESRELGCTVSRVVFTAITARIGYDHAIKEYAEPAGAGDGTTTGRLAGRQDTWRRLTFRVEKRFGKAGSPDRPILYGQYRRTWNSSDDHDYRYAASTAGIGIEMTW
jgi:hypothetical protein